MGLDQGLYAINDDQEPAELIYWRKANAIHRWFADHVTEDGEIKNCEYHPVTAEQLEQLAADCTRALELWEAGDEEGAAEVLTPTSGFFWGPAHVDDWWAEALKETVEKVNGILRSDERADRRYAYWAWW